MPQFSGPYAGEFRDAWQERSNPPFVRTVLADGRITDYEWAQVVQRLDACFAKNGLDFTGYTSDGSYEVAPDRTHSGEDIHNIARECEKASGEEALGGLRNGIATNPNNVPIRQIMAECLVRLHVVSPGYTADDYNRDVPQQSFPYLDKKTGPAGFWKCNANPSTGLGT